MGTQVSKITGAQVTDITLTTQRNNCQPVGWGRIEQLGAGKYSLSSSSIHAQVTTHFIWRQLQS